MRYTECRMAPPALAMTASIDEDTVDFKPNYDSRELEPTVLPGGDPQPARQRRLRHRGRHGDQHGPAQPGRGGAGAAAPGHPPRRRPRRPDAVHPRPRPAHRRQDRRPRRHPRRLRVRPRLASGCAPPPASRASPPRRKGIVVTELPYGVGPEKVIERIKTLVQAKKLQGIADVKDLTDLEKGLRLVIEVKNGFHPEAILEQLYKLHPDGGLLRHQRRRAGRRPAAHAGPQGDARGLPRAPLRRRTPPLGVPARQGRRPAAPGRGAADRDPRHRRGDPADPRPATTPAGQGAADAGLRPDRGAGRPTSSTCRCAG